MSGHGTQSRGNLVVIERVMAVSLGVGETDQRLLRNVQDILH